MATGRVFMYLHLRSIGLTSIDDSTKSALIREVDFEIHKNDFISFELIEISEGKLEAINVKKIIDKGIVTLDTINAGS